MSRKLLLISPYPPKDTTYENRYSALASFGKNTVLSLKKIEQDLKIVVLADIIPRGTSWEEKNLKVQRVWKREQLNVYFSLLKAILKEKNTKTVLIELEWNLFGRNFLIISALPLFIILLRILKRKVFVVTHGVSLDFFSLSPQLGLRKESLRARLLNWCIKLFYKALVYVSLKVIVLEQHFADSINQTFNVNKAIFIPHGVDTQIKPLNSKEARKKLGIQPDIFLLVHFGFLTWYKGSDLSALYFLQVVKKNPGIKMNLIFAGGESQVHKKDSVYARFVSDLKDTVNVTDKMRITGFLPERELALYFSAADLLIFPYRVFISSSGPLSLAYSFGKPILVSAQLMDYFKSQDLSEALREADLSKSDVVFKLNQESFNKKLTWVQEKPNLDKLAQFAQLVRNKRRWDIIGERYYKLLFQNG